MPQQVLIPGFDPTSYVQLTGAQIGQLFNQSTFATSIGGVITTQDDGGGNPNVPNPNLDGTLLTYIWLRIGTPTVSGNFVVAYVWNPNSANPVSPTVLLNWNPITAASIPPASIQGFQIASNTIPATALAGGISASQVIGLALLFNTALTSASIPNAGAISGSFASGFSLTQNAIVAGTISAGAINSYTLLTGQVVLPANIDTTVTAPSASSVIMAINGAGQPAAWVKKAILVMGEPNNQVGYIPVVQADGSFALQTPTSAFPAGTIFAAAEIQGTGTISVTAVSATLNVWTLSTTNTTGLIAGQTNITLSGFSNGTNTKWANLNGTWLVTAVTANISFTVTTSGNIAGSGTTVTLPGTTTSKFANYIGSSNLNVGSSPTIVTAGTTSVIYNSTGNYTLTFATARGSGNFIAVAQLLDTTGATSLLSVKITAKTTSTLTVQCSTLTISGGSIGSTPIDVADLSIICI